MAISVMYQFLSISTTQAQLDLTKAHRSAGTPAYVLLHCFRVSVFVDGSRCLVTGVEST